MQRRLILTALLCLGAIATTAYAKGSLAVGAPENIAKDGVAVSAQAGFDSRALADDAAINKCRTFTGVSSQVTALCKVVATFDGQCVATAIDPANGTPGFGWGIGSSIPEAEEKALAACEESSPPERAGSCRVDERLCDVTG